MALNFDSNAYFKFFFDITTKCNLHCSYCFARKIKNWNKEISLENFNYMLNIFKKIKDKSNIILFGGEPLLHSKIDYILNELSKLHHQIIILSNGLLDLNLYKKALKYNFILSFTFHSNLKKFTKNINNLLKFKDQIVINILLENKFHKSLYNFAIKNNIKYIFTQIYDDNEKFINPLLYKKKEYSYIKNHDILLFQDKINYIDLIENHLNLKNKKRLCFFNEGLISMDLIYTDECRNLKIDLKKNPFFLLKGKYKKPIICNKDCGDCYGKIISKKIIKT